MMDISTTTPISDDTVFIRNQEVLTTLIDDDLIIVLDDDKGGLLGLNTTGNFIWQRLDGTKTLAEIVNELQMTYEVSLEVCQKEVHDFVQSLVSYALLEELPNRDVL